MRIGVVTTSYPRNAGDAAGSFVSAHVAAMRMLGHDVEVLSAQDIGSYLFDGGGAPEEMERGGFLEQAKAMLEGARFTAELTTLIYKRIPEWDVVIAHWLPCGVAAVAAMQTMIAAKAGKRIPLLVIAHGGDVHTLRRTHLLAGAMKALEAGGAKIAFVSDELRMLAGADNGIVQPMGVDVARFADIPRAPTTPPTIAVIGRLVPIKGVDVAIAAMSDVTTDAKLAIAGDGPERAVLEGLAAANTRIELLGQLDATARDQLLSRASIVVIPSRVLPNGRSEGTPVVALEALAAGVPVVASDVGGLRELDAVIRVPAGDPRALASAIDRVLASPPSSEELRASVAHLAWPRVAHRLLDVALDRLPRA
jgi:glycosyltransferase involved in cell wall biosynthesis